MSRARDFGKSPNEPKAQAREVVHALDRLYPDSRCAWSDSGPFQLLVATILSAQCTDVPSTWSRPRCSRTIPAPIRLPAQDQAELESFIRSTGFFRAKAKNLIGMATKLVSDHGGEVPADLDALTELPGVGRKTANVVLGVAFKVASGVVVDRTVKRLAYRLGLTKSKDPTIIEQELLRSCRKNACGQSQPSAHRARPQDSASRKPRCGECALAAICPRLGVTSSA